MDEVRGTGIINLSIELPLSEQRDFQIIRSNKTVTCTVHDSVKRNNTNRDRQHVNYIKDTYQKVETTFDLMETRCKFSCRRHAVHNWKIKMRT